MIITLVQLGNKPKRYFWNNLNRLIHTFGAENVCVISDLENVLTQADKKKVITYKYTVPQEVSNLFENHNFSHKFRNGFWQLSAIRLFAILDYSIASSDTSVLHIESDILLMPNFPVEAISKLKMPTWVNFNEDRDIASLVYLPSSTESLWLKDELICLFRNDANLTDMSALRLLSEHRPKEIGYFSSKFPMEIDSDKDTTQQDLNFRNQFKENHPLGIFDGAAIGMWLTGQDPNNFRGLLKRMKHLEDGPVDLRNVKFGIQRQCLTVSDGVNSWSIYNLHVHSKNSFLFGNFGHFLLKLFVFLSNNGIELTFFHPLKFIMLGFNKVKKTIA